MKHWKKRAGKMSYKGTVSLSLLCLIGVFLLIFCSYSYYSYRREGYENARREAANTAGRLVEQIDERLANLQQYYTSAMLEDDIKWMLENSAAYSDYSHYSAAAEIMASKKIFWDYIHGYALINFRTEKVLSNKGMFQLQDTYNREAVEALYYNLQESTDGKTFWFFQEGESVFSDNPSALIDKNDYYTIETQGLNLVMRLPMDNMKQSGLLIININMNTWQKWLQQWLNHDEIIVFDSDNRPIYTTNHRLLEKYAALSPKESIHTDTNITVDGIQFVPAVADSSILGWKYCVFYNMEAEQNTAMQMSDVMLLVILLFLLLCYYFTLHIVYKPVDRLISDVSGEKITGNELEYLANRFSHLKDDKQSLENMVVQQQDRLKELFELRLIRGEVRSKEELEEYLHNLQLKPYRFYAAAVMVLNLRDEQEIQSDINEDAICLKLVEDLPEHLKKDIWMPLVYNACTLFCVFGRDDESELLQQITAFYSDMQQYAEESCGYRILMGVSATHTDYRHMMGAYRECVNALTMPVCEDISNTTSETEADKADMSDCHFYLSSSTLSGSMYNNSFEKDIRMAMKAMDKEQCYKVVDSFYAYFSHFENHDDALVHILGFVNAILLTALDAGIRLQHLYPDGLQKLYEELVGVIEPGRVRRYIKRELVDKILQERIKLLEESSYSILEEIERLIAESKGNITLAECAESLGVHTTYIWKVLKMERGKSFSDYLEEYKLNEAKRLLLQTNLSVTEIAAELNYTNAQNFIRFFSKSTGVTPGKFRKLY